MKIDHPADGGPALTAVTLPAFGLLMVGHVAEADRHNQAVPIPVTLHGFPEFEVDAQCRDCPARSELSHDGPDVLLLIVHHDGCPSLAARLDTALRKAGYR